MLTIYPIKPFIILIVHYSLPCFLHSFLQEKLKKRFIKSTAWPLSSPDCNPMDYLFWDKIQTKVYEN